LHKFVMVPDVLNHWPKNKRADGNQMHSEWENCQLIDCQGQLPNDWYAIWWGGWLGGNWGAV